MDLTETICGTAAEFARKVHIKVYNSVSYRYQPFQRLNEVDKQLLRCTAKWRRFSEGLTHNIWVCVTPDREKDTFQGRKACFPLLYGEYTPSDDILMQPGADKTRVPTYVKHRRSGNKMVAQEVPTPIGLAMVIPYKYVRSDSLPNKYHGCVEVQLDKRSRFVVPIKSIEGAVQLVPENIESKLNKIFLVNNYIDLDTFYYVY